MGWLSRTDRSALGQWWWTIDRPLLVSFLVLMVVGVLMVATASPAVAESLELSPYYFLKRHLVFLLPTCLGFFAVSFLSPRMVWRLFSLVFIGIIFAMIAVLVIGVEIKGARRWLHLPGFSLQPSEFLKPAFAVAAAWFMTQDKERGAVSRGNVIAAGLYITSIVLLLMQPDFGITFVTTCIWAVQIFLVGLPLRYVFVLGGALGVGVVGAYFSFSHVRSRIDRFLNPDSGDNYQVQKSLESFEAGGIIGVGPGQGSVKMTLPDAHADFIFAVAGEEMGLIFVWAVMAIFAFIVIRSLIRISGSTDLFNVLATGGLLAMFALQAIIHMGSSLNLLPAKGMTLPFISYGGSSMLAMGLSMGAVMALTRRQSNKAIARGGV